MRGGTLLARDEFDAPEINVALYHSEDSPHQKRCKCLQFNCGDEADRPQDQSVYRRYAIADGRDLRVAVERWVRLVDGTLRQRVPRIDVSLLESF